VEQVIEYLKHGVALSAVNVPAMTAEQYRAVGPFANLAERLGTFAAYVSQGNPRRVRITYHGRIAEQNTALIRNAGIAGVLGRSLAHKANVINALQIAADRGLSYAELHEAQAGPPSSVKLELESDAGITTVEGGVVFDRPRLILVDGIRCEAPLSGHLIYLVNYDVPGVIGWVGTVLGKNNINIANFSLGRQESAPPPGSILKAAAIIETDGPVPDSVLQQLLENKAVRTARSVHFRT
jgi:D-3-phosphoglycerate dehydrogenase / 2-oxoglutarate reductase